LPAARVGRTTVSVFLVETEEEVRVLDDKAVEREGKPVLAVEREGKPDEEVEERELDESQSEVEPSVLCTEEDDERGGKADIEKGVSTLLTGREKERNRFTESGVSSSTRG